MSHIIPKDSQPNTKSPNIQKIYTRRLDSILDDVGEIPYDFDLLSIDVEGYELSVIKSLNFNRYSPKLIIVEMHNLSVNKILENKIYQYLKDFGYAFEAKIGVNGIFKKINTINILHSWPEKTE